MIQMNPSVLVGIPQTIKKQKRLKDTDASFFFSNRLFLRFFKFFMATDMFKFSQSNEH